MRSVFKISTIRDLFFILMIIYFTQGALYPAGGSIISQGSLAGFLFISAVYFIKTLLLKNNKNDFYIIWTLFLMVNLIGFLFTTDFSPRHITRLKTILTGMLPFYPFYHFAQKGELKIKDLRKLFLAVLTEYSKAEYRDKGYVYLQDFISNNDCDTSAVLLRNRAAAEKRMIRKNDFRASGSGQFSFEDINKEMIKISLEVSQKLQSQSMAFDFIEDRTGNPLIVEMSYGFGTKGITQAPGYWDHDLQWHEGKFTPQEWMVEDLIKRI